MPARRPHSREDYMREALRLVDDPEVGMSIVDLGLSYRMNILPDRFHVKLTMPSAACPWGDLIPEKARRGGSAALPQDLAVDVVLVGAPPWTPDMMSESARQTFGWPG